MAQRTEGLHSLLSLQPLYQAFQNAVGARRLYRRLVRDFLGVQAGMRVLDIGCGPAAVLQELPEGIEYYGVDSSAHYIERARAHFGARGHFWAARVNETTLAELPRFDRVLALGLLHHLDDPEAARVFELAKGALAPEGRVVTYDPCWIDGQSVIARFLIARDRGQNVRRPEGYAALARSCFGRVESQVLSDHLFVPYDATVLTCYRN